MTFKRLIVLSLIQCVLLVLLKLVFFKLVGETEFFSEALYVLLTLVVVIACARRLGVINFLEAMFVAGLWFFLDIIFDLLITSNLASVSIFKSWHFWTGYLALLLGVFFFHKKRHVEIRKEHAAHKSHHHGHHDVHGQNKKNNHH